ncbi:MAG TPA: diguanylate cyclase [Ideonella sp.]|uniref:sensor domain-containing protein n=1 Tax=Ideonella sp. TaxID=1929293 RepID=UPI002E300AEB|nr:diguanylate cyclase [Ideonella sp.]HEX5688204.1 diguanylate cyclase [Ideonella sp.]
MAAHGVIGALVAAFGVFVVANGLNDLPWVDALIRKGSDLGPGAGLLFVCAGLGLSLVDGADRPPVRRAVVDLCALTLMVYSSLVLAQSVLHADWGLDFTKASTPPTPQNPHPGRVSLNSCLAFAAAGAALLIANRPAAGARQALAATVAVVLVLLFVLLGMVGQLLGLQQLYRLGGFNQLLFPSAAALLLLTVGFWSMLRRRFAPSPSQEAGYLERRIVYRALTTLTIVALAAGLVGFAVMRETFERTIIDNARDAARTHALALSNTLQTSLWFPRMIAARPGVLEAINKTRNEATEAAGLEQLKYLTTTFVGDEVVGLRFLAEDGRLLSEAGQFLDSSTSVSHDLSVDAAAAELLWSQGYVLRTHVPLQRAGQRLGTLVTEQRVRLFDEVLQALRQVNESSDAVICSVRDRMAACAPSRFYSAAFTVPLLDGQGKPSYPITLALNGDSGAMMVLDARAEPVAAGYAPIGDSGLGLVVKTDVHTLYTPIRHRFNLATVLIVAFVLAGTWALRARVRPLLAALVAEQRRSQAILDTSSDAFIAIDAAGRVSDWNAEASRLFGWGKSEAMGRTLPELIIPPQHRQAHEQGLANFVRSGAGPVVNRRTEIAGRHRDGHEIPIELSISAMPTADGFAANAFVRDIRERHEAQQSLAMSERRLHEVIDNIPAMVGCFDRNETCIYANDLGRRINGLQRGQEQGLSLREAVGDDNYALHAPHIQGVLSGQRRGFEATVIRHGRESHYQAHLIPQTSADGEVTGFYAMSFDVTALRRAQLQLERSEGQLRAITDNLPVMISYIDKDQQLRFVNRTFEDWTGIPIAKALNRPLAEVIGRELYEQRSQALNEALSGKRIEFEVSSDAMGTKRVLHTLYIPDMAALDDVLGVYTLTTDVTAIRESERKLAELALNDPLTGLANRRCFEDMLAESLSRARRLGTGVALMFLDVDQFKAINDTHGHAAGDAVLIEFARRLEGSVRSTDSVARLAGDEFVVILDTVRNSEEARRVAEKVLANIRKPMQLRGGALNVTTSIGVAYQGASSLSTPSELLAQADEALYAAKVDGRDTLRVVPQEAQTISIERRRAFR